MNEQTQFDAIVVGSGLTGGWAAKELTEKGLKVLVLERGHDIRHGVDYTGEHAPDWKLPYQGKPHRKLYAEQYPVQSKTYAFSEANRHMFINDRDDPYISNPDKPFRWIRGGGVGGRSLLWGRQTYRWSEQDFEANKRDGQGIPWPIGYRDIAPWYSYVEEHIGVSGQAEGLDELPDGEFLPPMEMYALEKTIKARLAKKAPDVTLTIGRTAVLTRDHKGRAACHYCGPCHNGCSTGSYFSSQSSTLPAARATGNLTLKANAVVERLVYDPQTQKVAAVEVIDSATRQRTRYSAKLFFMCASTIGTTQVLLNSTSATFPDGLANRSGALGHYLMDHLNVLGAMGIFLDNMDTLNFGNRPNNIYIPRFRNLPGNEDETEYIRGFGYQGIPIRSSWTMSFNSKGFGPDFKDSLRKPGAWMFVLAAFGECLPYHHNSVTLAHDKPDRFGIPQASMEFTWGKNEKTMWADIVNQGDRLMKAAGAVFNVSMTPEDLEAEVIGGGAIHEMGTARMGDDPSQAVLNGFNQAHDVANLFVTDGACMTSSSCVNPSLTYMALTARACDYAVARLAQGQI